MNQQGRVTSQYSDIERRDPIGAIRHYAKQLWKDSGGPREKCWEEFLPEAERRLIHGTSSPRKRTGQPHAAVAANSRAVAETFPDGAPDWAETFRHVLYSVFREAFVEHESICFYWLLSSHRFTFCDSTILGPFGIDEVAGFLVDLAGEYPQQIAPENAGSVLSRENRLRYWRDAIQRSDAEDSARTFHDRNTMSRLARDIQKDPRVLSVSYDG